VAFEETVVDMFSADLSVTKLIPAHSTIFISSPTPTAGTHPPEQRRVMAHGVHEQHLGPGRSGRMQWNAILGATLIAQLGDANAGTGD
jgi:hypothetical protein